MDIYEQKAADFEEALKEFDREEERGMREFGLNTEHPFDEKDFFDKVEPICNCNEGCNGGGKCGPLCTCPTAVMHENS